MLIYKVWYTYPLFIAVGVGKVSLLLLCTVVLTGPFLTFLVFEKKKKSLRFDLTIIVAIQIAAFGYGISTVFSGRPVWMVFNVDRFDLVQKKDLEKKYADKRSSIYLTESWVGPRWVASRLPEDPELRNALIFESAQGGADLPQRVDLYLPLSEEGPTIRKRALNLTELYQFNSQLEVEELLKHWPEADSWLPMQASSQAMTVLIRKSDARIVAIVDLRPWK